MLSAELSRRRRDGSASASEAAVSSEPTRERQEQRYQDNVRLLASFLMVDRLDADSVFAPYYATLPPRFSALPCCWEARAFEALGGEARARVQHQRAAMVHAWLEDVSPLVRSLGLDSELRFEHWEWSLCAVWSRAYLSRKECAPLLVPVADMFNQASMPKHAALAHYVYDGVRFELSANAHYEPGDEVFVTYGQRAPLDLALSYGFVLPLPLPLSARLLAALPPIDTALSWPLATLEPSPLLWQRKRELLRELHAPLQRVTALSVALSLEGTALSALPEVALLQARVLALSASEFLSPRRLADLTLRLAQGRALSVAYELAALDVLRLCLRYSRALLLDPDVSLDHGEHETAAERVAVEHAVSMHVEQARAESDSGVAVAETLKLLELRALLCLEAAVDAQAVTRRAERSAMKLRAGADGDAS